MTNVVTEDRLGRYKQWRHPARFTGYAQQSWASGLSSPYPRAIPLSSPFSPTTCDHISPTQGMTSAICTHEDRPQCVYLPLLSMVLNHRLKRHPWGWGGRVGGLCPQHRGAVTPTVKTNDETRRYLWAHGGTTTWGGVRQVDVIHRVFHQWPFDHVHVGDGEDALPGRPRDPPFVPVLVHLSEQRDPLTL